MIPTNHNMTINIDSKIENWHFKIDRIQAKDIPRKIITFFSDFSKFLKNAYQAYNLNSNPQRKLYIKNQIFVQLYMEILNKTYFLF